MHFLSTRRDRDLAPDAALKLDQDDREQATANRPSKIWALDTLLVAANVDNAPSLLASLLEFQAGAY